MRGNGGFILQQERMNDDRDSYYAVIFTAEMAVDVTGYADTTQRINELVQEQPGYIGKYQSMEGNREITISYWESLEAVKAWKAHPEHQAAQELGRSKWYVGYQVRPIRIDKFLPVRTDIGQGPP